MHRKKSNVRSKGSKGHSTLPQVMITRRIIAVFCNCLKPLAFLKCAKTLANLRLPETCLASMRNHKGEKMPNGSAPFAQDCTGHLTAAPDCCILGLSVSDTALREAAHWRSDGKHGDLKREAKPKRERSGNEQSEKNLHQPLDKPKTAC